MSMLWSFFPAKRLGIKVFHSEKHKSPPLHIFTSTLSNHVTVLKEMSISIKQPLILSLTQALLHEASNLHRVLKKTKSCRFIFARDIFFSFNTLIACFLPLSCVFSLICERLLSLQLFVLCCCHPNPHLQLVQWIVNTLLLLILPVTSYFLKDHKSIKSWKKKSKRNHSGFIQLDTDQMKHTL